MNINAQFELDAAKIELSAVNDEITRERAMSPGALITKIYANASAYTPVTSLADHRAAIEATIGKLTEDLAKWDALPPAQRIAEVLHSKKCHMNHPDMCGWEYTDWANYRKDDTQRLNYLASANAMLDATGGDEAAVMAIITHL